jgi:hypothetical protein
MKTRMAVREELGWPPPLPGAASAGSAETTTIATISAATDRTKKSTRFLIPLLPNLL